MSDVCLSLRKCDIPLHATHMVLETGLHFVLRVVDKYTLPKEVPRCQTSNVNVWVAEPMDRPGDKVGRSSKPLNYISGHQLRNNKSDPTSGACGA